MCKTKIEKDGLFKATFNRNFQSRMVTIELTDKAGNKITKTVGVAYQLEKMAQSHLADIERWTLSSHEKQDAIIAVVSELTNLL